MDFTLWEKPKSDTGIIVQTKLCFGHRIQRAEGLVSAADFPSHLHILYTAADKLREERGGRGGKVFKISF